MKQLKQQNWLQHNWPLKHRGLFIACILSITASLLLGLPITRTSVQQLELQSIQLSNTLKKQVSIHASDAIFSQDLLSLNVILNTLVSDPLIQYGAVYNLKNEIIAEQGTVGPEQGHPLSIRYQNEVIGLLEVHLDRQQLDQSINRLYGLWFILSSLFTIVACLVGWLSGRYIGNKLALLKQQIENLGQGNHPIKPTKKGELYPLSLAINHHHQELIGKAEASRALTRFMATPEYPQPVNQAAATETHIQSHAAVLFINIHNLSHIQPLLPPADLAKLLDQYYELIHQAAALYNGHVDRYHSKGVMVLFGVVNQDEKDCFHGACMTLLLAGLLNEYNQRRTLEALPCVEFQLGLHSGLVNLIDRDGQIETTHCDTLHTASQVSHLAEANRALMSEAVIEQGQLAGNLIINKHEKLKRVGSENDLQTFWVQSFTPNYQALIDRQVQHIRNSILPSEV